MSMHDIPLVDVVSLSGKMCPTPMLGDLKYTHCENFVGRLIAGYHKDCSDFCLLSPQAALKLCQAQTFLNENYDLGLLLFDGYRPLRAVKDFVKWFDEPVSTYELERKAIHYPLLEKKNLGKLGYIADTVSNHCYGQSIDLTLINLKDYRELNMGTCFDFFDTQSHATMTEQEIGTEAYHNRKLLFQVMHSFDFQVHPKEYWHFDFKIRENTEPLDIEITPQLRGLNLNLLSELSVKGNL